MTKRRFLLLLGKSFLSVLLILLILFIVVPRLGGTPMDTRILEAKADLITIRTGLEAYKTDVGSYPTSLNDLCAIPPQVKTWKGPYLQLKEVPLDPWGNPYRYAVVAETNSAHRMLWSIGPDGTDGTEDDIYPP